MNSAQTLNRNLGTIAWGMIFVWWGLTALLKLPNGTDAVGIGLILLGVNATRSLHRIPTIGFSVTLGILALAWGGLDLARSILHLPLELAAEFGILLSVLGVILLARAALRIRSESPRD